MVRIPLCNSTRFGRGQSLVSAGLNNSPEGLKNSAIASSDRASILKQYITYGQGSAIGAKMSSGSGLTPKSRNSLDGRGLGFHRLFRIGKLKNLDPLFGFYLPPQTGAPNHRRNRSH